MQRAPGDRSELPRKNRECGLASRSGHIDFAGTECGPRSIGGSFERAGDTGTFGIGLASCGSDICKAYKKAYAGRAKGDARSLARARARAGDRSGLRCGFVFEQALIDSVGRAGQLRVGVGLRSAYFDDLSKNQADLPIQFFEVHPENYMQRGGIYPRALAHARERFPILTHGLSMSIGGSDPIDRDYLHAVSKFVADLRAPFHSDHLCFSSVGGHASHDLLPLPQNEHTVKHVTDRIRQVQSELPVPFAIENISAYWLPPQSPMDEGEFVSAVVAQSGCKLLLDVNNVYVNAKNHGFDPRAMLAKMPLDQVVQIHVAGHITEATPTRKNRLIDTHSEAVCDDVLELLQWVLPQVGRVPVLIERDDNFCPLTDLMAEARAIDGIWSRCFEGVS